MSGILSIFLIMGILIWQGIKESISYGQANGRTETYEEYKKREWEQWRKKNGF